MAYIQVPDNKEAAQVVSIDLTVTTGRKEAKEKGVEAPKATFKVNMPKTLGDAVALLGEGQVYRYFVNAYVVFLQGEKRTELQPQVEGKERKKAPYLQSLGL